MALLAAQVGAFSAGIPAQKPTAGQKGAAMRGEDVQFGELARREQARPPFVRKNKPTRYFLRGSTQLPAVDPALIATGTATRAVFEDTSPVAAPVPVPGQFLPADGGPSPPPSASFQAVLDDATAFNPDSSGAVGTNHIMGVFSSAVQIMDRLGNQISLVTLSNFWGNFGAHGNPDVFDPRLLYDPYLHRWIHVVIANPGTNDPGLLVAVSQSSDPTGGWHRYFIDTDLAANVFPDSPNVGFTRDWIVIQANMFDRTNFFHQSSDIWVFNKSSLYAGAPSPPFTRFSRDDLGPPANAQVPAATYDNSLGTNYLVANWNGNTTNGGFLRVFSIATNGGSGQLELTPGAFTLELPLGSPEWDTEETNHVNFATQAGTTNRIYLGDARIGNVVFRESSLWLAQTVFLPAGGSPTRAAVQWWEITPGGVVIQRGRIEDTVGPKFFAYPSVAVSRRNDLLVGYSRFTPGTFPSAQYSFRIDADLFGSLRDPALLKAGEAKFFVNDFGINRWGDWSGAAVDPNSDTDLWTLQQYASTPVAGSDRWGTWWGRVSPPSDLSVTATDTPDPVIAGSNVTYSVTINTTNNKIQTVTGVRLQSTLPAGAAFVMATASQGSCSEAGGVITCDFGTVGDTGRVTATLVVKLNNSGAANNSITVSANGPELTPANNTVNVNTTVNPAAEIAVSLSGAPDPVTVSNTLVYSLTVTNRGPNAATATQLTNHLPPNVTFVSAVPSQGSCSHNAGVVNCALGSVPNLGSATVQITIRPNGPGTLTNRANVASAAFDGLPSNNSNVVTTLANASPTIGLISNRSINEDATLAPVSFTIGDAETAPGSLTLSGSSSQPALVPNASIVYGGSGASRTISVTPAPNASGVAVITTIVTDALGATGTNSFQLTVLPVNDPPTINNILDFAMDEDTTTNFTFTIGDIETSSASLTVSGISSNTALVPNGSLVFGGSGASRTLAITPSANQAGVSLITVTVSDGTNTTSDNFLLTVRGVNDPPSIAPIANRSVNEDTATTAIAFTIGDIETPGSLLTVSGVSSNTTLVPNANIVPGGTGTNRTVVITPGANQFGTTTIALTVTDTNSATATSLFQITVNPVNDPPSLNSLSDVTVNEDAGLVTVALTGLGSGAANETQTVNVTAASANPAFVPNPTVNYSGGATGLLSFTSAPNANGAVVITVTATDDGASNQVTVRTFTVNVNPVNDPPTISDIGPRAIDEDTTTGAVPFTVGDIESPTSSLTLSGSSSDQAIVPNANITFSGAGANRFVTVTPAPNANGSCVITVNVSDGEMTAGDTFTLTVNPVSDPPSISAIADRGINEDTTTNLSFTVGDLESPAASLTVAAVSGNQALVPNLNLVLSGVGSTRSLAVTPAAHQFGTTLITLTVNDPEGGSNSTSFTLTVNAVNDPPVLGAIGDVTVNEDSGQQSINLSGISSGAANESQTLTLSAVSASPSIVPNPSISYTNGNATGVLRFTPAPNATGDATITVTIDDGAPTNRTSTRQFVIHVLPVNDPPIIGQLGGQTMQEDGTLVLNFLADDLETAPGSLSFAALSSNDELLLNSGITFGGTGTNRTLTIRPLTNAFGSTEILITATDADNASSSMFFEVQVNGVNDAPTISLLGDLTINEDSLSPVIPFTIGDPENLADNLVVSVTSGNATLVPSGAITLSGSGANRSLRILPATNQFGSALITVVVSDTALASSNSFTLTVQPVNDLPTITDLGDLAISEDNAAGPLAFTVGDVETAVGALLPTGSSSDQTLVPNANIIFGGSGSGRTVTVTPAANRFGSATITVTITDGNGGSASDTFLLTVNAINDPPTLTALSNVTRDEDFSPFVVNLSGIGPGGVNESQALTVTALSSDPAILPHPQVTYSSPSATGTLTFTPAPNASGAATVTVTVMDDAATANTFSQVFIVTVNPINDPPTLEVLGNLTLAEDSPQQTVNLTGIGTGAPNENQVLTIAATSDNTSVVPHPQITYASPGANGTLNFTPLANAFGSAVITVTVNDGGPVNPTVIRTFTVTVNNVNDPPAISSPGPRTIAKNTSTNVAFTVSDVDHAAGSLTVTATSGNQAIVPNSGLVVSGATGARNLAITPATNQSGVAVITLTVTDGAGAQASASFPLTVSDVTFPPTITDNADRTAPEDTPVVVPFTVGDVETAPAALIVTVTSSSMGVVPKTGLVLGGSGSSRNVTITPLPNQTGPTTIAITVTDGDGQSTTDTFVLTYTNVNDAPTLTGLPNLSLDEDAATGPLSFTIGDVETPAASLTPTGSSSNAGLVPNGNVVFGGSGATRTVTVTPLPEQSGSTTITLALNDGNGGTTNRSFVLTVNPVNDLPTLNSITDRSVAEDSGAQAVALSGISAGGGEAQALNITAVSSAPAIVPNPTVTYTSPNASGTLNFTPAANATGSAVITVTANDGAASNNLVVRTFTVTVTPTNDAPTISAIANQQMLEDGVFTTAFTITDSETPASSLTLSATSTNITVLPGSGIFFSGSASNRTVTFVPEPNRFGTTLVTVAVSDGVASISTSFVLGIVAVNDAPTLDPLTNRLANTSPGVLTTPLRGIGAGGTNETDTPLTLSSTHTFPAGFWTTIPTVSYSGGTTGILTYRPANNQTGTGTVSVIVNDGRGSNNLTTRSFTLHVRNSANILPTISTIAAETMNEDAVLGPLAFTVRDAETAAASLLVSAVSSNQAVIPNSGLVLGGSGTNRTITITPAPNASGSSIITLKATDAGFAFSNMNFVVTVNALNDLPAISAIGPVAVNEDTSPAPILFNVTDAETAPGALMVTASSGNQALVPNGAIVVGGSGTNRALLISPAANQSGSALITVNVSDGAASVNTSFTLTVNATNDAPTLSNIADQTTAEDTATAAIPFTVGDLETPAGSLTLSALSSNTGLLPVANIVFGGSGAARTVTLTPVANQSGSATVTVTVSDGAATASDTFTLTVTPANDPPTLDPIANLNLNQNASPQTVSLTGISPGTAGEGQTLIIAASSSNPGLVPHPTVNYTSPAATGSLAFTPAPGSNGTVTISVTVNDGQALNNLLTRTFTVTVNGAPAISTIPNQFIPEDTASPAIPFTVSDPESAASSLTVTASSSNTGLIPNANVVLGGSGANRTVTLTPLPGLSGFATITVTATDPNGNATPCSFLATVAAVNDAPTLNPIGDLFIAQNSGLQTVALAGIGTGAANETQTLSVMATSSNPALIPNPTVNYTSPNATGSLTFTSAANSTGTVVITVKLMDNGGAANGGVNEVTRTFNVSVGSEPPQLWIELASGQAVVSWSSAAGAGWTLQSNPEVTNPGGWQTVAGTPALVADRYRVTNSISGARRFYRLCQGCVGGAVEPTLSIRKQGAEIVLTWPEASGNFVVESRNDHDDSWVQINDAPVIRDGQYSLNLPATGPAKFFRLRTP